MAYDKIIDSAKLDSALTASADAIRAKTGDTADIAWDETSGFASAISGITPKVQSKTVTPAASSQTVKPDSGYDGLSHVTVNGDSDLKAANIAKGVNIFGVTGTLEASKIATGSFLPSGSAKTQTISGLGFKPARIFVYLIGTYTDEQIESDEFYGKPLFSVYGFSEAGGTAATYTTAAAANYYTEEEYDEDADEYYEIEYYYTEVSRYSNKWIIAPTSDGFTITDGSNNDKIPRLTYGYVAIG